MVGTRRISPVVVGMGGNMGDVVSCFRRALEKLRPLGLVEVSRLYKSVPIGPAQPDFHNAAALLDWEGELPELLQHLQQIELEEDRVRAERWGPRTLDLDILWAGSVEFSSSSLTVPHRELAGRAFALLPLLDLVPQAKEPSSGTDYRSVLSALTDEGVAPIAQDNWWKAHSAL